MKSGASPIAASSGQVYYTGKYWNDYVQVRQEINRRATGKPDIEWFDHFFKKYPGPYKKVLMLNCGNGWLERRLHEKGYVQNVVGVDYAPDLLREAKRESKQLGFRYYRMDINTAKFPEEGFDLVINHAAAHHIANLNKVFCSLASIMTTSGLFVNYDYVGPHRNQYPLEQWRAAHELNKTLAPSTRQTLKYPHLPTMLVDDPSEAVHAELILPIMKRYFSFEFYNPLGGALAYPLLTHNDAIATARKQMAHKTIEKIMAADKKFLKEYPESTLFAYWVAKPEKQSLNDKASLKEFQKEENQRETRAKKMGGYYYPLELIQELYLEIDEYKLMAEHKQKYIEELHGKHDKLKEQLEKIQRHPAIRAKRKVFESKQKVMNKLRKRS